MDVKINSFKKLFHVNGDGTFTSLKYTLRRPEVSEVSERTPAI